MMIDLIIIIAFLTSLILLILLRPIAFKLKLLDFPTKRKDHIGNVPLIGGICIYFGVIMSYGILNQHDKFSLVLLITSTFILIQGVWDDCSNVKAKYKMALQGILTVIVIYITDVNIPVGTQIYVGPIGPQPEFGLRGNSGFQYQTPVRLPEEYFVNTDWLNFQLSKYTQNYFLKYIFHILYSNNIPLIFFLTNTPA